MYEKAASGDEEALKTLEGMEILYAGDTAKVMSDYLSGILKNEEDGDIDREFKGNQLELGFVVDLNIAKTSTKYQISGYSSFEIKTGNQYILKPIGGTGREMNLSIGALHGEGDYKRAIFYNAIMNGVSYALKIERAEAISEDREYGRIFRLSPKGTTPGAIFYLKEAVGSGKLTLTLEEARRNPVIQKYSVIRNGKNKFTVKVAKEKEGIENIELELPISGTNFSQVEKTITENPLLPGYSKEIVDLCKGLDSIYKGDLLIPTADEKLNGKANYIPYTIQKMLSETKFGVVILHNKETNTLVVVFRNSKNKERFGERILVDIIDKKLESIAREKKVKAENIILTGFNIGGELANVLRIMSGYQCRVFITDITNVENEPRLVHSMRMDKKNGTQNLLSMWNLNNHRRILSHGSNYELDKNRKEISKKKLDVHYSNIKKKLFNIEVQSIYDVIPTVENSKGNTISGGTIPSKSSGNVMANNERHIVDKIDNIEIYDNVEPEKSGFFDRWKKNKISIKKTNINEKKGITRDSGRTEEEFYTLVNEITGDIPYETVVVTDPNHYKDTYEQLEKEIGLGTNSGRRGSVSVGGVSKIDNYESETGKDAYFYGNSTTSDSGTKTVTPIYARAYNDKIKDHIIDVRNVKLTYTDERKEVYNKNLIFTSLEAATFFSLNSYNLVGSNKNIGAEISYMTKKRKVRDNEGKIYDIYEFEDAVIYEEGFGWLISSESYVAGNHTHGIPHHVSPMAQYRTSRNRAVSGEVFSDGDVKMGSPKNPWPLSLGTKGTEDIPPVALLHYSKSVGKYVDPITNEVRDGQIYYLGELQRSDYEDEVKNIFLEKFYNLAVKKVMINAKSQRYPNPMTRHSISINDFKNGKSEILKHMIYFNSNTGSSGAKNKYYLYVREKKDK